MCNWYSSPTPLGSNHRYHNGKDDPYNLHSVRYEELPGPSNKKGADVTINFSAESTSNTGNVTLNLGSGSSYSWWDGFKSQLGGILGSGIALLGTGLLAGLFRGRGASAAQQDAAQGTAQATQQPAIDRSIFVMPSVNPAVVSSGAVDNTTPVQDPDNDEAPKTGTATAINDKALAGQEFTISGDAYITSKGDATTQGYPREFKIKDSQITRNDNKPNIYTFALVDDTVLEGGKPQYKCTHVIAYTNQEITPQAVTYDYQSGIKVKDKNTGDVEIENGGIQMKAASGTNTTVIQNAKTCLLTNVSEDAVAKTNKNTV